MPKYTLCAVYITYQCVSLDYCLEASLRASLDLCDRVYVNDGGSTDGTLELLEGLQKEVGPSRLVVVNRKWTHDRGFWARERNYLLDRIPDGNYVINMAADECLHEDDFDVIRNVLPNLGNTYGFQFNAVHLYGRPDYRIRGARWARVLTKLWKNSTGIRYINKPGGCADDPLWPNKKPAHHYRTINRGVHVFHYGHARSPQKVAIKNTKADSLYRGETIYSDGSFPVVSSYDYRFEYFLKRGGLKPLTLKHPKYMQAWVARHKNQATKWKEG